MADAIGEVESMAAFKRDTATVAARLKKSGKPLVLTVNGKEELVVQDAAAYRRLQELAALAEKAEMMAFLTRSRADIDAGNTLPAAEFVKSLGTKS